MSIWESEFRCLLFGVAYVFFSLSFQFVPFHLFLLLPLTMTGWHESFFLSPSVDIIFLFLIITYRSSLTLLSLNRFSSLTFFSLFSKKLFLDRCQPEELLPFHAAPSLSCGRHDLSSLHRPANALSHPPQIPSRERYRRSGTLRRPYREDRQSR